LLTVYYSPHASSIDNEAGRASGHADVPLSALGQQQAAQRGVDYAEIALDAVFCSDLQRAYTTAQIAFSARGLPILPDARLREFDYGDMTQVSPDDLHLEQRITEPFPNGESVTDAMRRMGDWLRDAMRDYDGKTILVIGHRATRNALEYWSGDASLENIISAHWEWRDVPIWRYEFNPPLKRTLP
jgi:alpha-ribazole phosphatase/probable phosphoglycerate mutase